MEIYDVVLRVAVCFGWEIFLSTCPSDCWDLWRTHRCVRLILDTLLCSIRTISCFFRVSFRFYRFKKTMEMSEIEFHSQAIASIFCDSSISEFSSCFFWCFHLTEAKAPIAVNSAKAKFVPHHQRYIHTEKSTQKSKRSSSTTQTTVQTVKFLKLFLFFVFPFFY